MPLPDDARQQRAEAHRARVAPQAEAFLQRRCRGEKHPVWDFLFTYYSFSPAKLMAWHPAMHEEIERNQPPLPARVRNEAGWIAQLCENILQRSQHFKCHGLHEWAMVYRQSAEQVRHSGHELRLAPEQIATFVASQSLCCTHFDAFRFFAPDAKPMNAFTPDFESRPDLEQGGCLHANMDIYKWSYKLWPWIGSDLVADAFEVAVAGRDLDMRASPYDLVELGFAPVRIETEEGREEYRRAQQQVAALSEPVRLKLREAALRIAASEVS